MTAGVQHGAACFRSIFLANPHDGFAVESRIHLPPYPKLPGEQSLLLATNVPPSLPKPRVWENRCYGVSCLRLVLWNHHHFAERAVSS